MSTVTKLYFSAIVKIATHNLHCGVLSHFTPGSLLIVHPRSHSLLTGGRGRSGLV